MKAFKLALFAASVTLATTAIGVAAINRMYAPAATANLPLAADTRPVGQSEPALALAGDHAAMAWTDMRNTAPDIYARLLLTLSNSSAVTVPIGNGAMQFGQPDVRGSNVAPSTDLTQMFAPAVTVEANGNSWLAFTDYQNVYIARLIAGRVYSRTRVNTQGSWNDSARNPQLVSDGSGNLLVTWEDYRNQANVDNAANRGSDIYMAGCSGLTMQCQANTRVNVDITGQNQLRPRLARAGNQIALVWEDHSEQGAERPRIYATLSGNGGGAWSSPARINKTTAGSVATTTVDAATAPDVAIAPDGGVWATWEYRSGTASAAPDIYAARFDGSAWSVPTRVDAAPANTRALQPVIASGSAGTWVAWTDYRAGTRNPDVYSARLNSTPPAAATWSEIVVTNNTAAQRSPRLEVAGNRVWAVWRDDRGSDPDIYLAQWNGSAWGNETRANELVSRLPNQMFPDMVSANGRTYAGFIDTRSGYADAYMARLLQQGNIVTWTAPIRLPTQANDKSEVMNDGVDLAIDGSGLLHAMWIEYYWESGRQIFYATYGNTGWNEPMQVTGNLSDTESRYLPAMAARGDVVAGVWAIRDNVGVQLQTKWKIGNSAWSSDTQVLTRSNTSDWLLPSSIALDGNGNLFVAWREPAPSGQNNRAHIWLARRNVNTPNVGWTYSRVNPTNTYDWCDQRAPQITVDQINRVHVAWSGCKVLNPANQWQRASVIFYAISTNQGASFSAPAEVARTLLANDGESGNANSQPAINTSGYTNRALVSYPAKLDGTYKFYAVTVDSSNPTSPTVPVSPTLLSDGNSAWATAGNSEEGWYGGDSRGAVAFDQALNRWVFAFPDRRSGRASTLMWSLDPGIEPPPPTPTPTPLFSPTPTPTPTATPLPGSTPQPARKRISLPAVMKELQ